MTIAAKREARAGWLLVAPGFLLYLLFALIPVVVTLGFSLTQIDSLTWQVDLVGIDNLL